MTALLKAVATLATLCLAPAASAATLSANFSAISFGGVGSAKNTLLTYDIGSYSRVTAIEFSTELNVVDPGFLVEHRVLFGTSTEFFVTLQPGHESETSGTIDFSETKDLVASGWDFDVNEDGLLKIEFIDTYNRDPIPLGKWDGSFTITYDRISAVPEPAAWGLMILGFGFAGTRMRYRARPQAPRRC